MARAKEMLEEASEPAYSEELRRAHNLARFLDPTYVAEEKGPLLADKGLAAAPQRKVDASAFEGMRLVRKEDRDEDYLPAAKKGGKKGKKSAAPAETKFHCPPSVIADCAFLGVNPPMSAAEIPQVLEKVKAKIAQWKADQPEQTRKVGFPAETLIRILDMPLTLVPYRTSRRPRRRLSASRPRRLLLPLVRAAPRTLTLLRPTRRLPRRLRRSRRLPSMTRSRRRPSRPLPKVLAAGQ